ncbi:hypothetical protein LSH36_1199g00017 [Paralvinella palmiformis]|uniref:Uncharacterized protein n=1 Tax=Paralvinella palmiformis TaxID=53620 RepID=A0AAD9MP70_9ANNE|nr:hypothetical protein LSH36_1199g00017 [Paralvinella palmiformis]
MSDGKDSFDEEEQVCKVPKLSLDDKKYRGDFKVLAKLSCRGKSLFHLQNSVLRINRTLLDGKPLSYCIYAAVDRIDHWKVRYSTSLKRHSNFEGKVDADFFRVQCYVKNKYSSLQSMTPSNIGKEDSEDITFLRSKGDNYNWNKVNPDYDQFVTQVHPRNDVMDRVSRTKSFINSTQLNVVIYGIDSMSRVSWKKILPKSYTYLRDTLKSVILQSYNIIGDGTVAALLPILTGHTRPELLESRRNKLGTHSVDVFPLIWKDFNKSGYVTLFAEDSPEISVFSLRFTGFDKPPVDHYMRPFWLAASKSTIWKKSVRYCIGNKPKHQYTLDYMKDFFDKYPRVPKFAFGFHTELSHEHTYPVQHIDQDLTDFLYYFKSAGHLDNTLLIVMADHGPRFADRCSMTTGKLEERLPMMSLTFPERFKIQYPHLIKNLMKNRKRLTTPFDIYETLKSVLNIYNAEKPIKYSDRGISLLNVIPANRTCTSAEIELNWCTCMEIENISVTDKTVQQAATFAVSYINKLLYVIKEKCYELTLKYILDAKKAYPNEQVVKYVKKRNARISAFKKPAKLDILHIQLTIETSPNNGLYGITVDQDLATNTFAINGDYSRLNVYGKQPHCIMETHPEFRKYCLCRKTPN